MNEDKLIYYVGVCSLIKGGSFYYVIFFINVCGCVSLAAKITTNAKCDK